MTPFDFRQCPGYCERIRRMLLAAHPILTHMHEEPAPTLIPADQALAQTLELIDNLELRLAMAKNDLAALREDA